MERLFEVVHEDTDLLVINKPAGLVCHPTKGDVYSSLISRVRLYLEGSGLPQLINRLDRETSGLVVIGKRPDSSLQLRLAWESHRVEKEYWAIVHGSPESDHGMIDSPLGKAEASPVAIKDCVRADGQPALTEFWVQGRFRRSTAQFACLRVQTHTGRKHQIRIHLASRGHPLVGDKLYGPDELIYLAFVEGRLTEQDRNRLILPYHALHARGIRFAYRGAAHVFQCEPEKWFTEFESPKPTLGPFL